MSYPVDADDLRAALEEILIAGALRYREKLSAASCVCDERAGESATEACEICTRQELETTYPLPRTSSQKLRVFAPRNSFASSHFAEMSALSLHSDNAHPTQRGTIGSTVPRHPSYNDEASSDKGRSREETESETLDLEEFMAAQRGDGGDCADDIDGGECHLEACTCSRSRMSRIRSQSVTMSQSAFQSGASRESSASEPEPRCAGGLSATDRARGDADGRLSPFDDVATARDANVASDNINDGEGDYETARRVFGHSDSARSIVSCQSWDELEQACADLDAQNVQILELDLTRMIRRPADADVRRDLLTVEFLAPSPAAATAAVF